MLHWFAGAKTQEVGNLDPDATAIIEPPETPAPVFAVRAFKHAIFGTPGTVPPKALRRHSNTDNGKPRPSARPGLTRPKSASDTRTLGTSENPLEAEPMPSPAKGILMTPGTAAGTRRKTVSFGAHVQDNEGKRPGKSGLPDDCPGKFPSPWTKLAETAAGANEAEKTRGRNKLTQKLEQVRDESAKRKPLPAKPVPEPAEEVDVASNFAEPGSDSEGHWKLVYEQYRERSERECRKLVSKQKAAKSYAREKDEQCTELADQLRQEKKKVTRLEKQIAVLQAQLREYQRTSQGEETSREEAGRRKLNDEQSGDMIDGDDAMDVSTRPTQSYGAERDTTSKFRSSIRTTREKGLPKSEAVSGSKDAPTRPRVRPRHSRKEEPDEMWALLASSSLIPGKTEAKPPSPKVSRTYTSENPLKPLDINTLPQDSVSIALSMGLQPPSPEREHRSDSPMRSAVRSRPKLADNTPIMLESSSFLPEGENERPNVLTGTPVPIKPPKVSGRKENGSPTPKASRRENVESKNSARASAADLGDIGKNEIEDLRAEARRLLAKEGRVVS